MRRSVLLLPALAIVTLSGCVIGPPPLPADPSPDVSQPAPSPDPATQPSPTPSATQEETASAPDPDDDVGPITAGGEEGSVGNPYPPGAELTGGDWTVALFPVDVDAEPDVVAGGGLPAPEGWRWISAVVEVSTTSADASSTDVWASYVAPTGEVYFSVIDSSIPGTNPVEDMVPGRTIEFIEYLLAPEEGLEQGVMAITTAGLTSFVAQR